MKKYYLILLFAGSLLFFGCSKDEEYVENEQQKE